MRFIRIPLVNIVSNHAIDYPTPVNLSYLWGFGSSAGIFLALQVLTGVFLSMHYCPHLDLAYYCIEHMCRDVHHGWFLRHAHSNGASVFFLVVYLHLFRGLYFVSYRGYRSLVWFLGVSIFLVMMATAFMGYVLPWGQMSLWAATVITSLFSAIPWFGDEMVNWLWGWFLG
jgi:ubiquinol-cytochrome c reductase cytochrome b subunit